MEDNDLFNLRIAPEALIAMNDAQRIRAVQLWELFLGIRIWKDEDALTKKFVIRYELGDGRQGCLFTDGGNADGVRTHHEFGMYGGGDK